MTTLNLFGICAYTGSETEGSLTLLDSQDIVEPLWDYKNFQGLKVGGGGLGRAVGWATAEWHWKFMDKTARDFLRAICSGVSENVLIKTKTSTTVYGVFTATMYWPSREVWSNNFSMGLTIAFSNLVTHA